MQSLASLAGLLEVDVRRGLVYDGLLELVLVLRGWSVEDDGPGVVSRVVQAAPGLPSGGVA